MIKNVTVIGAGLMGAGIAAHLTNAGTSVTLLDIPDDKSQNRNNLADQAVSKLIKIKPAAFTLSKNAKLIKTGNIDDHLHLINQSDWVIEVIIEDLKLKKNLYEKIEKIMKDNLIITSNTSTIPLSKLTEGRDKKFKTNFFITHFFNPPRYLRLLEIVGSDNSNIKFKNDLIEFCDHMLGKSVIDCKDTPGFIGNRIGAPKTGIFGLLDLVGLDLMPHVMSSMTENLDKNDEYNLYSKPPEIFDYMLENKLIGRKGIGGFYKLENVNGKKVKTSINLITKEFLESKKPSIQSTKLAKKNLNNFLEIKDKYSQYALSVVLEFILYTLNHAEEIANDLLSIDNAMKNGFGLAFGPFELMDKLGKTWIKEKLLESNIKLPKILNNLLFFFLANSFLLKRLNAKTKPKIVIVGLGIGGATCLQYLNKISKI